MMAFRNNKEMKRINSSENSSEDKHHNTILSKLNNNDIYYQKRESTKNNNRIRTSKNIVSSVTNNMSIFDKKVFVNNENTQMKLFFFRSKSVIEKTSTPQKSMKTLDKNIGHSYNKDRKDRIMESNKAINNSNNIISKQINYLRNSNFLSFNDHETKTACKKLYINTNKAILSASMEKFPVVNNNRNTTNRDISRRYLNQKNSEVHNYNCYHNYINIYNVNKSAKIKNLTEKYQLLPSYSDYSYTKTKALSEIKCSQSQFSNVTALMGNFNIKVSKNSSSWEEKKHKNGINNILVNNYKTYNMNYNISSKCSNNISDINDLNNCTDNDSFGDDYDINVIEERKSDDSIDTDIILNMNNIKKHDRSLDGKSNRSYSYYNHQSNNNILNDDFLHISFCKNKDIKHDNDNEGDNDNDNKDINSGDNNNNNDDNNDRQSIRFSNTSDKPSQNSSGKLIKYEDYNEDTNEDAILYTNKRVQKRINDLNVDSNSSNNLYTNESRRKVTIKKNDYISKSSTNNSDNCDNKQSNNKSIRESMNTKATSQVNSSNNYFSQSSYSNIVINNSINNNTNVDSSNNNIVNENASKYTPNKPNNIYTSNNKSSNISFNIDNEQYKNNYFKNSGSSNTFSISNNNNNFFNRNINYNQNYLNCSNKPNYYDNNYNNYNNTSNINNSNNNNSGYNNLLNSSLYNHIANLNYKIKTMNINNNKFINYRNDCNKNINNMQNMHNMHYLLGRNQLNNSNYSSNYKSNRGNNNSNLMQNYNHNSTNNNNACINTKINNSNYQNSYNKFPSSFNESEGINKNTNFICNNNENNNHQYLNNKSNYYNNSNTKDQSNFFFKFTNNNNNSSSNNKNKENLFDSNTIYDNTKTSNLSDDISLFNISNYEDEYSEYMIKDIKKKEVVENVEFNKQKLILLIEKLLSFSLNEIINLSYSKTGSQVIQSFIDQVNYLNLNTNNNYTNYTTLFKSELSYILKFYDSKIKSILFKLIEILPDIMENQFSSFAFQKILPYANEYQRLAIWKKIETKIDKYSVHKIANRCLQDIISSINCFNEERYVTKLFFSNEIVSKIPFISLSLNEFGFFVIIEIIKIIEKRSCSANNNNFSSSNNNSNSIILYILEKLVSFTSKLIVNKYGVNIFKHVIEIVNSRSNSTCNSNSNNLYYCLKQKIIDIILSDFNKIAKSKFGYYGLSTLFNIYDNRYSIPILKELIDNIEEFCICSFSFKLIKRLLNSIKKDKVKNLLIIKILSNIKDYDKLLSYKLGFKTIRFVLCLLDITDMYYMKYIFNYFKEKRTNLPKRIELASLFSSYNISFKSMPTSLPKIIEISNSELKLDLEYFRLSSENALTLESLLDKFIYIKLRNFDNWERKKMNSFII